MITRKILAIAVLSVCFGCENSLRNHIIDSVDKSYLANPELKCKVSLKTMTPFQWDKLYFFNAWTTSDSIGRTIKYNYKGNDVKDDYVRMLFTLENRVVYEEDFKPFDYSQSTIDFSEIPDSLMKAKLPFLTPKNSMFVVSKEKTKDGCKDCFDYSFYLRKAPH